MSNKRNIDLRPYEYQVVDITTHLVLPSTRTADRPGTGLIIHKYREHTSSFSVPSFNTSTISIKTSLNFFTEKAFDDAAAGDNI